MFDDGSCYQACDGVAHDSGDKVGSCVRGGGGGRDLEIERDAVHHAYLCDDLEGHDYVARQDAWLAEDSQGEQRLWGDVCFDQYKGDEGDGCYCK